MKTILANDFENTYDKRDVDARIRVLNEKEVIFQTTSPPTFIMTDLRIIDKGTGYAVGQWLRIGVTDMDPKPTVQVTSVDASGGILTINYDTEKAYNTNPQTMWEGTVQYDDAFDGTTQVQPNAIPRKWPLLDGTGQSATISVKTAFAPGDTAYYGTLGLSSIHDPLVKASHLIGFIDQKLEGLVALKFIGYVSKYDPRWPWSETKVVQGIEQPKTPNKPVGSPAAANLKIGDLWYCHQVNPNAPDPNTGAVNPETAFQGMDPRDWTEWDTGAGAGQRGNNWPVREKWGDTGDIKMAKYLGPSVEDTTHEVCIWDGVGWTQVLAGYFPGKLHMWETLNVDALEEGGASIYQNNGFFWLDAWKLYSFSIDETRFMHLKGDETVEGVKTFDTGTRVPIRVPARAMQFDSSTVPDNQREYATRAEVAASVLLLSGSNTGASQTVNGDTFFTGRNTFKNDFELNGDARQDGTPAVFKVKSNVSTQISSPIVIDGTSLSVSGGTNSVFNGSVRLNGANTFSSSSSIVIESTTVNINTSSGTSIRGKVTFETTNNPGISELIEVKRPIVISSTTDIKLLPTMGSSTPIEPGQKSYTAVNASGAETTEAYPAHTNNDYKKYGLPRNTDERYATEGQVYRIAKARDDIYNRNIWSWKRGGTNNANGNNSYVQTIYGDLVITDKVKTPSVETPKISYGPGTPSINISDLDIAIKGANGQIVMTINNNGVEMGKPFQNITAVGGEDVLYPYLNDTTLSKGDIRAKGGIIALKNIVGYKVMAKSMSAGADLVTEEGDIVANNSLKSKLLVVSDNCSFKDVNVTGILTCPTPPL